MIPQSDPAWVAARVGKVTASRMKDVLDFTKKGEPGADRKKYLMDLVAERAVGAAMDHYVTAAMQWGLDNEAPACERYEAISGNILMPSGFYDHPTIEMCGASPDREIDHDGLAEVKCPTTTTFVKWKMAGVVPEEHKPQMLLQLACTRRRYVDFIAYDPRITMVEHQLFVRRFEPKPEEIAAIEEAARQFLKEVEALFDATFVNPQREAA